MSPTEQLQRPHAAWATLILPFLAVLTIAAAALLYLSPRYLAEELAKAQTERQATIWQRRILSLMERGAETFVDARLSTSDETALGHFIMAADTYRYVLYDADGVVFASSKASKIGKTIDTDDVTQAIRRGQIYHETAVKQLSEIDNLDPAVALGAGGLAPERLISEIYLPVFHGGRVVGAIEHYRDNTETISIYEARLRLGALVIGTLAGLVFVVFARLLSVIARRRERLLQEINEQQRRTLEGDRRRSREHKLISELNEWLQSCQSLDELYVMVSAFLGELFNGCPGSIYVYANSRDALIGSCSWNDVPLLPQIRAEDCWALRRGRAYTFGANVIDFRCNHVDEACASYFCVPIVAHGETVGLLHLVFAEDGGEEEPENRLTRRLALICAEQISLAIANVRLRDQLRDQSIRDPLTGLFNRRYFTETCRTLFEHARRSDAPFSIASFDIDHFKKFNDNHGHDIGDLILRSVSDVLDRSCVGHEVACRIGGEEFMLILPDMTAEEAALRAESIRRQVADMALTRAGREIPMVTISAGIASFPEDGASIDDIVKSADEALYRAKSEGRNQVVRSSHREAVHQALQDSA